VHDAVCRLFANRARRAVLSVDYRRPPEHPFPAAPDDMDTVVGWLRREGPPGPYAAHGDSAGANLALVAALRHPGFFSVVALVYPFLDPRMTFPSWVEGPGSGFDPAEAAWYWEQYAASEADYDDPDLAPLLSDRLHTLPPTLVATAEHDPLRDEGEELARLVAETGVETVGVRCLGQTHGFWRHPQFAASEPLVRQVAGWLDQHLGGLD
jgi:acetyl esterase